MDVQDKGQRTKDFQSMILDSKPVDYMQLDYTVYVTTIVFEMM